MLAALKEFLEEKQKVVLFLQERFLAQIEKSEREEENRPFTLAIENF